MKNKKVIGLLASLGCVAIAAGAGLATTNASAASTLGGVDVSSFQMTHGASVRFKAKDGKNGIRFEATLSDGAYGDLEALQSTAGVSVNYGMLIVPADIVASKPLTLANVFGTSAVYTLVEDCNPDGETCICNKTHIASVQYETMSDANTADGKKNLRGSLVDILPNNINREFVGLGYIEYDNNGTKTYVLAENALALDSEGNPVAGTAAQANNTRSMTYVAQLAIEAGKDDSEGTLQTSYVTPLAANDYKYTVNHYLPTGTGGAYELKGTETLYGKLGSSVAAVNIAKSTLTDKAQYTAYATYGFDTSSGAMVSGKLYANGRTVFNCYYVESDTTLWSASDTEDVALLSAVHTTNNTNAPEATAETVESYAGSGKALKLTLPSTNQYGAGHLYLDLDEDKLEIAENANWDYLTVRMLMQVEQTGLAQDSAVMYNGSVPLKGQLSSNDAGTGGIPFNTWVDLTVPKALLNNKGSYVLPSKSYDGAQAKAEFDAAFRKMVITQENTSCFLFAENLEPVDGVYPTVTYYIESITWGVDTTAPEIVSVNAAYAGTAYTPVVTVQDNIVPNTAHWATAYGPIVTSTLYEVNTTDNTRDKVEAGTPLESAKKYVLVVTADDRSVTNLPGNVLTEEVEITVRNETDIVRMSSKYDDALPVLESKVQNEVLNTASIVSSVSDGTTTKNNVIKIASAKTPNVITYDETTGKATAAKRNYGGYVFLALDETRAQAIYNAYADTSTTFTLTISMYVEFENQSAIGTTPQIQGIVQSNTNIEVGKWTTVTITEADFNTKNWVNDSTEALKYLTGGRAFFNLYNAWATETQNVTYDLNGTTVTTKLTTMPMDSNVNIYIDSITYSVTPNA